MIKNRTFFACIDDDSLFDYDAELVLFNNTNIFDKYTCKICNSCKQTILDIPLWQSKNDFLEAQKYTDSIVDEVICDFSNILDEIHNTDYGCKGWDIVLHYALSSIIPSLYIKYVRIKNAINEYNHLYLYFDNEYTIINDAFEFVDYPKNRRIVLQQFVDVFRWLGQDVIIVGNKNNTYTHYIGDENIKSANRIKHGRYYNSKVKIIIGDPYLGTSHLKFFLIPFLSRIKFIFNFPDVQNKKSNIDTEARKKFIIDKSSDDDFVRFLYGCLWKYIPQKYIENFRFIYDTYKTYFKTTPKALFTCGDLHNNIIFQLLAIDTKKNGGKINIIQHGGNEHMQNVARWAMGVSSKYYIWGNTNDFKEKYNVISMPAGKMIGLKKKHFIKSNNKILFVEYTNTPELVRFTRMTEVFINDFQNTLYDFIEKLEENIFKQLYVRTYMYDLDVNQKNELIKRFPCLRFDETNNYYKSLKTTKLLIVNCVGTTWVEAIYMNIPTIVFAIRDEIFEPEMENMIKELKNVDIWLDTPEDAARLVNQIGFNPQKWWKDKNRQRVIKKFRYLYAYKGLFPRVKWMREIIKEL